MSRRAYTLLRRIILVAAVILGLLLARHFIAARGGLEAFYAFRSSEVGMKVLAPFDPFGRAITASSLPDFMGSAGEAAMIDVALLAVVVLLDANYVEAALSASRRRYAQLRRIRSGSLFSSSVKGNVTWWLPRPPWAGGAGPIAWRQATSAARSAKGLLLLLLILAIGIGPLFASQMRGGNIAEPLVMVAAWLTVLLSGMLKFDFRGDVDHIEVLKTLPLRPAALAAGQLIVPTFILTAVHVLLLASVAAAVHEHRDVLLVAACLALPFNALLISTENLIFLLFPTRPPAASPGDFQVLGRQAVQLVMKAAAVAVGCSAALVVALLLFIFSGGSLILLTAGAAFVLGLETWALIPAITWAYNRFDPSVDTPA